MSDIHGDIQRRDSAHTESEKIKATQKIEKQSIQKPSPVKQTHYSDTLQTAKKIQDETFDEYQYFQSKLNPLNSKKNQVLSNSLKAAFQESPQLEQAISQRLGLAEKKTEPKNPSEPLGQKNLERSDKKESLLAVILLILEEILKTQSQTQSKATVASAKMANEEASFSAASAQSQYQSDMQQADIDKSMAVADIVGGGISIATGALQFGFSAASASAEAAAEEAPEGLSADEVTTENPQDLEQAGGANAGDTSPKLKAGEPGTKSYYKSRAKMWDRASKMTEAVGKGTEAISTGFMKYEAGQKKQQVAKQTAVAALYRMLSTMVQSSQQATAEVGKKSGDVAASILDVIRQAMRTPVDVSSMKG